MTTPPKLSLLHTLSGTQESKWSFRWMSHAEKPNSMAYNKLLATIAALKLFQRTMRFPRCCPDDKLLRTFDWLSLTYAVVFNSGVSPKHLAIIRGGYRSPLLPPTLSIACLISLSSALLIFTSIALAFSSRYLTLLVPGIGMKSSPCARTQANDSCPGVHPFFAAISESILTSLRLSLKCSSLNLGWLNRV